MAKRMQELFQRPMAELREAFVRTRFAEDHCFGRPDIEEWLTREREAERPECDQNADESPWDAVLCNEAMMLSVRRRKLGILKEYATPLTEMPPMVSEDPREAQHYEDLVRALLSMVYRTRVNVYYGYRRWQGHPGLPILVTTRSDGDHVLACDLATPEMVEMVLRPLDTVHVVDALFAEWLYGRPRWRKARQFICDALAKSIRKERRMAEDDFDEAVAVSADGTRIVRADRVFTFDPRDPIGLAYANITATEFSQRGAKVLLMPELKRNERMHGDGATFDRAGVLAELLQQCMDGRQHRQVLATSLSGETFLITHPDFMPELEDLDAPPWSDEA